MIKVLSIIGATASGKSDLALQCADKLNGEIVSCDSVQIYKYFNIGSAKPSSEELASIPHYLIDILEPTDICNAGLWRDRAIPIIQDIHQRGKLPIIVGGTGLYLKSLYYGMFEEESRNQKYRESLQERALNEGIAPLYQELTQKDPTYAQKIAPTESLRIIRALEAIQVTRKLFSELHLHNKKPTWDWYFTQSIIDRDILYNKIEKRVHLMLEQGLIEEVKGLIARFGSDVAPMKTIGYKHISQYLLNNENLNETTEILIRDTRRFAKRQLTLFRSLVPSTDIIEPSLILSKGVL